MVRWSLFALFPGFFVYHFLVAKQWLPPLLGGYSSAMAALLLAPLGWIYATQVLLRPVERTNVDAAFMAFIGYYALAMSLHIAFGERPAAAPEHFGIIVQFLSLFFVLRLLPITDRNQWRWLLLALLAMSATIALNASEGSFVIATLDLLWTESYFATYQAYAFVYLVTFLLVLAPLQKLSARLALYLLAVPILFLNGARTEFVGIVLLVLCLEFLLSKQKWVLLGAFFAVLAVGALLLPLLADLFPESRTLLLFLDYSEDLSANQRTEMLVSGWRSIMDSPWVGALGSHAPGEHIHNGLSAWVDLGLPGFLAYALLILIPTLDLCLFQHRRLQEAEVRLAFSLLFLTALFAITSKHYTHQLLPLALAAYARLLVHGPSQRVQASANHAEAMA